MCFFWRLLLKFQWIKYLGKGLSYLKKWAVVAKYYWNYGLSKLPLHFIEYRLDQLNSKHKKTAENETIQYFEGCSQRKCQLKVWRFLVHPPCKIFTELTRNHFLRANIFKLHEYQTFGLIKMHNMCKIWFANNIFSLLWWNKKYFSRFFKGFQLPEIVSDLRLRL